MNASYLNLVLHIGVEGFAIITFVHLVKVLCLLGNA